MDSYIFDRIGGRPTLHAAANLLAEKVTNHKELYQFFRDGHHLHHKLEEFFLLVLKAPTNMTEERVVKTHQKFLRNGLNEEHFKVWLQLLHETFEELSIPDVFTHEAEANVDELTDVILKTKEC